MKGIQVSTKQPICFLTKSKCIIPTTNQLSQDPTTIEWNIVPTKQPYPIKIPSPFISRFVI
jgi:hypothetical protein